MDTPPPTSSSSYLSHSHTPMHTNLNNWIRWDCLKRGEKERERIRRGKTYGAGSFILLNIIERLNPVFHEYLLNLDLYAFERKSYVFGIK